MIKWYKNNKYIPELDNNKEIDSSYLKEEDEWYAEIIPYDGYDYGFSLESQIVKIEKFYKLVFISDMDGDLDIYTINSDGTGLMTITSDNFDNKYPSISPDGKLIAFSSDRDEDEDDRDDDIFIMSLNSSNIMNITQSEELDACPSFHPKDSSKIIFDSWSDEVEGWYGGDIFIVDLNSKDIIHPIDDEDWEMEPSISPDGNKIVFITNWNFNLDIYRKY